MHLFSTMYLLLIADQKENFWLYIVRHLYWCLFLSKVYLCLLSSKTNEGCKFAVSTLNLSTYLCTSVYTRKCLQASERNWMPLLCGCINISSHVRVKYFNRTLLYGHALTHVCSADCPGCHSAHALSFSGKAK